ncbi:MAG: hypothetical protein CM1200mP2_31570 [Planctomycetaceae bacterium]|nr:MAG: hypothetical protein CM1200mP2_31570 [Planctomycetaceae bacterium]
MAASAGLDQAKSLLRRARRFADALGEAPERRYLKWVGIFDRTAETISGPTSSESALASTMRPGSCGRLRRMPTGLCHANHLLGCPDLSSLRHPDQGRHRQHGFQPGVPQPAPGPPRRGKSPPGCHVSEAAGSRGKTILVETFRTSAREDPVKAQDGIRCALDHWFRNELRPLLEDVLLDPVAISRGHFRPEAIRQLVDEHVSNRWDHSYRLWCPLCLEVWHGSTWMPPCHRRPRRPRCSRRLGRVEIIQHEANESSLKASLIHRELPSQRVVAQSSGKRVLSGWPLRKSSLSPQQQSCRRPKQRVLAVPAQQRSSPVRELSRSLPLPPARRSSPLPPSRVSWPSSRESFGPLPPLARSSPWPARITSSPLFPTGKSLSVPPSSLSSPPRQRGCHVRRHRPLVLRGPIEPVVPPTPSGNRRRLSGQHIMPASPRDHLARRCPRCRCPPPNS